jgi:hypothetical protein
MVGTTLCRYCYSYVVGLPACLVGWLVSSVTESKC